MPSLVCDHYRRLLGLSKKRRSMKKLKLLSTALLFLLLCLSACSKEKVSEDNVATEETKQAKTKRKSKSEDKSENEKKVANEDRTENEEKIENNGGYFVAEDNMVYFRNYGESLDGEVALFGDFLDTPKKMENAQICSYDIDTQEVKSEFNDSGFGELYLYEDTFYLKEVEEGDETVYGNIYSIKTDGSDRKDITKGHILAMNQDNGVYAVESYKDGIWFIELWQQDKLIYSFKDDKDEHTASFISSGKTDDYALFLKNAYDGSENPELWAVKLNEDGKLTKVGDIDIDQEEMMGAYPAIEQVAYSKDKVYFVLTLRGGTALTLQGAYLFEADLNTEGSLKLMDEGIRGDDEESILEIWIDESGKLKKGKSKPFSAWSYETDLMFCDKDGKEKLLCPDLFIEDIDNIDAIKMMQKAEFVKGAFFVISCDAKRSEEDDIGWREAYKCFGTNYFCIPAKEKSQEELLDVE